ncbi:hypothetical protein TNIN_310611 [Trichonephila inaurata madagascariensis]|uniref:Uncharacterized protein n=1 Tax=Trichonephila inaurata madagascariensis TaxID=2747483 RepID=A0A8X7CR49_9ARAC|nr:hypothetical protein TNIN_310611 [Trichonephila inaurata madagascariensis]
MPKADPFSGPLNRCLSKEMKGGETRPSTTPSLSKACLQPQGTRFYQFRPNVRNLEVHPRAERTLRQPLLTSGFIKAGRNKFNLLCK